ncbi:immunoglobulin lambda-1 light chain-like [Acanthopagrus latus]|uniref:immunoglobulin lambda-1 light chain-like n=1 Tax=Acanthopagrus latus TaxID=8177 RepID=UPI00187CFB99|nr:immunoglobulin lambda-1 light chain-like [Acanthopagrus latus]
MLFLPAAALCCLCSALVAMAAQLIQDDLTLTRRVDGDVSFSCRGTEQCDRDYVFWYQKKDTETFRVILDIDRSNGQLDYRYNHPQKNDFSAVNIQNGCELKIKKVKLLHSATYYCSCWERYHLIFGSGTKLVVTDEQVVKPVVSVYPAASRAHLEGRSSLLCVASAMFPPLVRFSWKRRKEDQEQWLPAEGEQLELTESERTAAILLVDWNVTSTCKYRCSVQHEGGTVEAPTEQGNEGLVTVFSSDSASCGDAVQPLPDPAPPKVSSGPSQYQVKLLCVLYTVLIVKSLVYCCGLSLLRIL